MNEPGIVASSESSAAETPVAETSLDIAAAPDRVWQALVSDGGLAPWMGDGASIDAQPGGRMILPDIVGGRPRAGRVDEIEDRQRLAFTWWPMTRPADRSNVSITIVPIETGTRVTVTERPPALTTVVAATTFDAASRTAAVTSGQPLSAAGSRSFKGFWAWRLAVLSLTCQAVRV